MKAFRALGAIVAGVVALGAGQALAAGLNADMVPGDVLLALQH